MSHSFLFPVDNTIFLGSLPVIALGMVATIVIAVLLWDWQLQRRVTARVKTIAAHIKQVAIAEERERIARELHDTLDQELTGLSLQLGNVRSALRGDNEPARRGLLIAQQMLTHSRAGSRATICDLRDVSLLESNLPEAMRQALVNATESATGDFCFEVKGTPQPLCATTANHLLRIACEAVSNAVRHANANRINARLIYDGEGVGLKIDDDGAGFQTDQGSPVGHFGLTGMRERAQKIYAHFSLQSHRDTECDDAEYGNNGCQICVELPWSSPVAYPRQLT